MKVVFVYPDLASDNSYYTGYFQHSIAFLSAVLKQAGYQTALIQFTQEISPQEFQNRIKALAPDLIGFSSTTHVFPFVKKYAKAAKAVSQAPIICGGVHPSISPQEAISDESIDMVCIGEGEAALLELCQKMERGQPITDTANIWVKQGSQIFRNSPRPLIENLDGLPFPDREVFDYPKLNMEKRGIGTFMFSRGCPYHCAFCCESSLRNLYPNKHKYFRFRSAQSAVAELKQTINRYPFIKFVHFADDLLFAFKGWLEEFSELYQKQIGLPFSADLRVNLASEEVLGLLKQAGCHLLRFGVESGSDFILEKVMNKGASTAQIKQAFVLSRAQGIKTQAYNMLGVPYEKPKDILKTIALNAEIKADISVVSIFHPYRGTQLYDLCVEKGFLDKGADLNIPKNYYSFSILSLPDLRGEQIKFFFRYFHILKAVYVFFNKKRICQPLIYLMNKALVFAYFPELAKIFLAPPRAAIRWLKNKLKSRLWFDSEALTS